ncbi:MAG: zinc ribbon domain-containing protein [Alphaproteobacteria bacterium]|nr:zinc ribbon domain-containing protein [Alphaproteobacteria bacterium]
MANNCANCGAPLGPDDRFCGECGTEVLAASASEPDVVNGEIIQEQTGTLNDLVHQIQMLMDVSTPWDKIIIDLPDSGDFLQFAFAENVMQLDFPLVTPEQKARTAEAFNVLTALDLLPFVVEAAGGEKVLVCDLEGTPQKNAEMTLRIATDLYGSSNLSTANFTLMGPQP